MLRAAIETSVGSDVEAVIVFGSVARGEASEASDIDLAVIAGPEWDGRADLQDAVGTSVGNGCDVLVLTPGRSQQLARSGEPEISDIFRDGVALIGSVPRTTVGAAASVAEQAVPRSPCQPHWLSCASRRRPRRAPLVQVEYRCSLLSASASGRRGVARSAVGGERWQAWLAACGGRDCAFRGAVV
jgi:hypothetical protein